MAIPGLPEAGSHTVFSHQEVVVVQLMLEILLLSVLSLDSHTGCPGQCKGQRLADDSTVYVGPGTYAEQLVIETKNLILMGIPGDPSVAGAAWNAPVLDGANLAGTTTGITITVEGVTISGFIIKNYDTAISQPVVVGSNAINIEQQHHPG